MARPNSDRAVISIHPPNSTDHRPTAELLAYLLFFFYTLCVKLSLSYHRSIVLNTIATIAIIATIK
jgi:hypothetical protein